MAERQVLILGFCLSRGYYFNARVLRRTWHEMQTNVDGNWNLQGYVAETASRLGLELPDGSYCEQVVEGGKHLDTCQLGILYQETEVSLSVPSPILTQQSSRPTQQQRPTPFTPQMPEVIPNLSPEGSTQQQRPTSVAGSTPLMPQLTPQCEEEDMDDSQTSSSLTWPHKTVLLLLEKYREFKWMLLDPRIKRMECFKKISTELRAKGHQFSPDQCAKKFDNMKSRHKIIRDRNGKTGRGRSSWVYFDLMDDLMAGDPSVQPPVRISSLGGTTSSVDHEDSMDEMTPSPTSAVSTPSCASSLASIPTSGTVRDAETPKRIPETPQGIRKRRRRGAEAPAWFKDYEERQERLVNRLADAMVERNDILKKMFEKM